jgi:Cd2+/Zn2+-exporting ATPase
MTSTKTLQLSLLLPEAADCADCVDRLRTRLAAVDGVENVEADPARRELRLDYDPDRVPLVQIEETARDCGAELARRFRHETLSLTGMDCADCAVKLERGVGRLPGVHHVGVSFTSATMRLEYDPEQVTRERIERQIRELGYGVQEAVAAGRAEAASPWSVNRKLGTTLGSGALLLLGFLAGSAGLPPSAGISAYAVAAILGGWSVARAGLAGLRAGTLDINFLMAVAVIGAAAIGDWAEGATVVFLFSLGELLESYTMERTRHAIRAVMALAPPAATVRRDGQEFSLAVEEIRVGEVILVRPGERIAMDGEVVAGESAVNQAPVTGESVPVEKVAGDPVFAGTINEEGALEVRVTRLARDNTVAKIIRLVEEAQAQKAPSQRFVDRFARVYTPAILAVALLVATVPLLFGVPWQAAIYRALVLLVISCPCALVISTPVAVVAGIGAAARHGALIKGGVYLEELGGIRAVALDKTGTLTTGTAEVTDVVPLDHADPGELLRIAGSIEQRSQHPLAQAIVRAARAEGLPLEETTDFRSLTGRGVQSTLNGSAYLVGNVRLFREQGIPLDSIEDRLVSLQEQGKTGILLGAEGRLLGLIAMADQPREVAHAALEELTRAGVRQVVMLTGDTARVARAVADHFGIEQVRADLLPEDKVSVVRELMREHGSVAMVGDGVNDAPALAAATVGVAMGAAGTDVALETADVALMSDDLSRLPYAIRVSRAARAIIRQNIAFSLLVKLAFLMALVPGWTTLWLAVLADTGATVLVVLNSLRLLHLRPTEVALLPHPRLRGRIESL